MGNIAGNFNHCSFASNDVFIATSKDKLSVSWGKLNKLSGSNTNGLPNVLYYGKKFYGNKVPVTKPPYQINLINVKVSQWNSGTQYKNNGCGGSSSCSTFNRNGFPYNDTGLAIESPTQNGQL